MGRLRIPGRTAWAIALAVGLGTACGGEGDTREDGGESAADAGLDGATSPDAGPIDDAGLSPDGGMADDAAPVGSIRITSPASPHVTGGASVEIQVFVDGTPDRVDLLVDGEPLVSVSPPFAHTWNIASLADDTYQVVARATFGGTLHTSAPLEVVVDRSPPRVIATEPAMGEPFVFGRPFEVTFSRPLDPASLVGDAVRVRTGSGVVFDVERALSDDGRTLTLTLGWEVREPVPAERLELRLTEVIRDREYGFFLERTELEWTVPLWVHAEPPIIIPETGPGYDGIDRPIVKESDAGELYVATRGDIGGGLGRVLVRRRTAAGWEPVDGAGCDGLETLAAWDFALGLDGRPLVTTVRETATAGEYAIRICERVGGAWQWFTPAVVIESDVLVPYAGTLELSATLTYVLIEREADGHYSLPRALFSGGEWAVEQFGLATAPALHVLENKADDSYRLTVQGSDWVLTGLSRATGGATTSGLIAIPLPDDDRSGQVLEAESLLVRSGCQVRRRGEAYPPWTGDDLPGAHRPAVCTAALGSSGRGYLVAAPSTSMSLLLFDEEEPDRRAVLRARADAESPWSTLAHGSGRIVARTDGDGRLYIFYAGEATPGLAGIGLAQLNHPGALP